MRKLPNPIAETRRLSALFLLAVASGCSPGDSPAGGRFVVDLSQQKPASIRAETRRLDFGAGSRDHLVEGWSGNEWDRAERTPFVWANRETARVRFLVRKSEDLQMLLSARSIPEKDRRQEVSVQVNGHEIGRIRPKPHFSEYRFVADRRFVRDGENVLLFVHSHLVPMPPDRRRFGAAFSQLLIGPACGALRPHGPPPQPAAESAGDGGLRLTGPIVVVYRLTPPPGARFRSLVRLDGRRDETARIAVKVGGRGAGSPPPPLIDTWLRKPILPFREASVLEADLSPYAGREIELTVEVTPEHCRSATTAVVLRPIGLEADPEHAGARGAGWIRQADSHTNPLRHRLLAEALVEELGRSVLSGPVASSEEEHS